MATNIYNVGSLNIDSVFSVSSIVRVGETLSSFGMERFPGGKGLNQSVALARAGAKVFHVGRVGSDGRELIRLLESENVDVSGITVDDDKATGQAVIQVDKSGENAIVLESGANSQLGQAELDDLSKRARAGDVMLLQNETNLIKNFIDMAWDIGMKIALNPAPMSPEIADLPLESLKWLIVNEIEAVELVEYLSNRIKKGSGDKYGIKQKAARALLTLHDLYPQAVIILTQGKEGVIRMDESNGSIHSTFSAPEPVKDTTAAGDTFIGYWLTGETSGLSERDTLTRACAAAALAVTKKGAASSIPYLSDVENLLGDLKRKK